MGNISLIQLPKTGVYKFLKQNNKYTGKICVTYNKAGMSGKTSNSAKQKMADWAYNGGQLISSSISGEKSFFYVRLSDGSIKAVLLKGQNADEVKNPKIIYKKLVFDKKPSLTGYKAGDKTVVVDKDKGAVLEYNKQAEAPEIYFKDKAGEKISISRFHTWHLGGKDGVLGYHVEKNGKAAGEYIVNIKQEVSPVPRSLKCSETFEEYYHDPSFSMRIETDEMVRKESPNAEPYELNQNFTLVRTYKKEDNFITFHNYNNPNGEFYVIPGSTMFKPKEATYNPQNNKVEFITKDSHQLSEKIIKESNFLLSFISTPDNLGSLSHKTYIYHNQNNIDKVLNDHTYHLESLFHQIILAFQYNHVEYFYVLVLYI